LVVSLDRIVVRLLGRDLRGRVVGREVREGKVLRFRRLGVLGRSGRPDKGGEAQRETDEKARGTPHPTDTARQVVVRVTPSIAPMPSVTSCPMASSVGPWTTAM